MNRLKMLREEKNLKQGELAKIIGVGQQAISSYESGKREPDVDTLKKLANYFSVSIDFIIGNSSIRDYIPDNIKEILEKNDIVIEIEEEALNKGLTLEQVRDIIRAIPDLKRQLKE